MKQIFGTLALSALAACSGNVSLNGTGTGGDSGNSGDTTVAVNEVFLESDSDQLTLNAVDYNEKTSELKLTNLPFDAADDTYTLISGAALSNGFAAYESNPATSDAEMHYFAVFRRSDSGNSQVVAAGTNGFRDTGFAGAATQRFSADVTLPNDGNYVYSGEYAGVRITTSEDSNTVAQFVTGDTRIVLDFDDAGTGTAVGAIYNRDTYDSAGVSDGGTLPNLSLVLTSIDHENASLKQGSVNISGGADNAGTWDALFAGPNGEELAGIVLLTEDNSRETGGFIID
ncbi:hypothetical protein [Shimia sagamensis]|uniref:Transferrin-binding protein B C-lobe/N-lobe beta barrel domain-containing protein n=1 Tax=Shimia sagamensis TaxID=1566352 RepID=A0ABY1NLU5_9RHOB|nr:hypothetical protein [Shimia sagamensis]SMP12908.1 hypothetical protein SAMN06265373_102407 [Shimia sagamensis]